MDFSNYSKNDLLYSSFNQTKDCVVFGTKTGFYVYTLNPFKKIIARKITGGVSLVEMLYKSNIIIFVGNVDSGMYPNKKLIIWDDHKNQVIGEISFKNKILNIKVTREIITVVTERKIFIYKFQSLALIKSIETKENSKGLCSVTYNDDNLIAYPGENVGEICITKYENDFFKSIRAHQTELELFSIDYNGKYIATSSERGTLIRIYDIDNNKLIKELRRGSDQIKIVDLRFSEDAKYLLCSSIKGTIHIFSTSLDIEDDTKNNTTSNVGIGYGIGMLSDYLPKYFSSEWSFSQFYLNDDNGPIVTYSLFTNNKLELISIGSNGCYYTLTFDEKGGNISNTYKFVSDEDDPFNDRTSTIK